MAGGWTMKLLLVDDEDQFRRSLMRQLMHRKYQVYEAADGEEAIEIISHHDIDITILDMRMPGLSGILVLNEIKKMSPLTEVIMLTGHATVSAAMKAIKTGAFDYITKPVRLDELINKMEDAYKKKELKKYKQN